MTTRKGASRKSITLDNDTISEIKLLAKKRQMTVNEWIVWAIENAISESHGQFGLAGITAQRLNQLQDTVESLVYADDNLATVITDLSKMMNTLATGQSYLNDEDGGVDL